MTSDVIDLSLAEELTQVQLHLERALRARDAEAERCTAMRQHLDGATAPPGWVNEAHSQWFDQYNRWWTAGRRLLK